MRYLQIFNQFLAKIEQWILIVIVLLMVLGAFLQVVLRNVLDQGVLWGDIFLRHLVLWVGFIGASLATKDEKHINIDLLNRYFKGRTLYALQIFVYLFALTVVAFLVKAGFQFVKVEKEFGATLFLDIPTWYFQIIIPIGFGIMGLRFAIISIQKIVLTVKGESGQQ
ncbi:MAG: TRAP transporter small permease subunit [Caldithrix sp.]|nr:TRAP transporter small permease subunit [Caldithrix sp.]